MPYPTIAWVEPEPYHNWHIGEALDDIGIPHRDFLEGDKAHGDFLLTKYPLILTEANVQRYSLCPHEWRLDGRTGLYLLENAIRPIGSPNVETPVVVLYLGRELSDEIGAGMRRHRDITIIAKWDIASGTQKFARYIEAKLKDGRAEWTG